MAPPTDLTGTIVLYQLLASDCTVANKGAEGDTVPALITKVLTGYIQPPTEDPDPAPDPVDAYDIWVFPDGEPMLFREAVLIGTTPGTIAEIVEGLPE